MVGLLDCITNIVMACAQLHNFVLLMNRINEMMVCEEMQVELIANCNHEII
jgi:hypothetical protein